MKIMAGSNLRRVQPTVMPKSIKKDVITTTPRLEMVNFHQLFINDQYQRGLSDKSMTLIRSIAKTPKWTSFHVPIITPCEHTEDGYNYQTYEILDGQHTVIGLLTNGSIRQIPCLIVDTNDVVDKASSFVDLNTNKVRMTSVQVFWAEVAANNENAIEAYQGATLGGGKILKRPPPYGNFIEGEIAAVTVLKQIAKRGGVIWVKRVVECGVQCQLAPIGAHWLRAFELLLLKDQGCKLEGDYNTIMRQVVLTVRAIGPHELMRLAQASRGNGSDSVYHDLAWVIRRNLVKE